MTFVVLLNIQTQPMAQKEGYRARAVYKLSEIDEQDHLVKAGMTVVDLGSAPGSWSQYVRNRLTELGKGNPKIESGKPDGIIIAIDILPMEDIADVSFIQGDFREDEGLAALEALLPKDAEGKVDLVLSDMAPNLSGVGVADAWPRLLQARVIDSDIIRCTWRGSAFVFNCSGI